MAEEAMDWWLPSSSIYFGQSRRPASIGPVSTLLECRATPRPRPSMPPSAWWSTLINWAGSCTRMKTKICKVDRCFSQARSVHRSYRHDSSSSKASWIGLLESHLSCLAYGHSGSWMLTSIACQLRLTMVSINPLPLTWPTIMYDATLARMGHGKYVGACGEPRRDRMGYGIRY